MLNQKKVEIFLAKFHKSLAKQFLEVAYTYARDLALRIENGIAVMPISILDTFNTKSVFKNNAEYVIVNKDKNSEINFIIKTIL